MDHQPLQSASRIIDILGGPTAVARLTHKTVQAVSNWKRTGRLAPDTFLVISKELETRGLTAEPTLWGIRKPESAQ